MTKITQMPKIVLTYVATALYSMKGEYVYYVESNFDLANEILLEAIRLNDNKNYPKKSLSEIYRKEGLNEALNELNNYNDIDDSDEE